MAVANDKILHMLRSMFTKSRWNHDAFIDLALLLLEAAGLNNSEMHAIRGICQRQMMTP